MRKYIFAVTLIVVSQLLALGQTTARRPTRMEQRAEEEIIKLNTQEVEALLNNDVKTLALLWSDDFVVTNPFSKFINKQQVLGMTASGVLAFSAYGRQIEYVHLYRDTAIVAGTETVSWAGKMPNAGTTTLLRFSSAWLKQGQRWQEVARHANIVIDPSRLCQPATGN